MNATASKIFRIGIYGLKVELALCSSYFGTSKWLKFLTEIKFELTLALTFQHHLKILYVHTKWNKRQRRLDDNLWQQLVALALLNKEKVFIINVVYVFQTKSKQNFVILCNSSMNLWWLINAFYKSVVIIVVYMFIYFHWQRRWH